MNGLIATKFCGPGQDVGVFLAYNMNIMGVSLLEGGRQEGGHCELKEMLYLKFCLSCSQNKYSWTIS